MTTVRQIERLWTSKSYGRLFRSLLAGRPETSPRLEMELGRSIPAAALAMIRLDELSQSYVRLYTGLLQTVLSDQHSDGGWGDPMTTALCVRALMCDRGHGSSIDRGLQYLANMQKTEGIWPNVPIRRMPADAFASAFVLHQLGDKPQFRNAIRFSDALNWFESNESSLDTETRKLWDRASVRCGIKSCRKMGAQLWSLVA
jgi:hypothetical protein